jgi:hypothetical protein
MQGKSLPRFNSSFKLLLALAYRKSVPRIVRLSGVIADLSPPNHT